MAEHCDPSPPGPWTSRLYEGIHDLEEMYGLLMEARARTSDWRYAHLGELAWSFFLVDCHLDPRQQVRLWHHAGRLVGYAILGEDPSFDVQVLPDYRWCGIEEMALGWAGERLSALRQGGAAGWGGGLVSGARLDDARRIVFLEQNGFRYSGRFEEVNLIRALDGPVPASPLPPGFLVRGLEVPGDIPDRAAAERDVWLPWTVGNVSDADYERLVRMPGYRLDLDLVAVAPGGTIASTVIGWLDPVNRVGDFGPVGAREAFRRMGLTRALLLEGLRRMQALGMDRVCISTTHSNTAARNLYESVGFRIVNRYLDYVKPA